jgi:hypothetical protein
MIQIADTDQTALLKEFFSAEYRLTLCGQPEMVLTFKEERISAIKAHNQQRERRWF